LKRNILRVTQDYAKARRDAAAANDEKSKAAKNEKRLQKELRLLSGSLLQMRTRVMMLFSVTMIGLVWALNSACAGIVAAKLPFEPFAILHPLTHRGLAGEDYTDCSVAFFFMLCSGAARAFTSKIWGEKLPREVETLGSNIAEIQESLKAFEERM